MKIISLNKQQTNIELIIQGCIKNRQSAQKRLFEMYYGYVFSVCDAYASNKEEAVEMLNDTFFTVFKNIKKYDKDYPFKPWIRKVTVNACLQYIRKYFSKINLMYTEEMEQYDEVIDFEMPSVEEGEYMKLLKDLSPAYRTIINLYVIEEYKHHEIANMLDISVNTSKSNLSRAKKILLNKLEKSSKRIIRRKTKGDE